MVKGANMKTNAADEDRYKARRKKMEEFAAKLSPQDERIIYSPSLNYELRTYQLETEKGCWNYTKGVVRDLRTGEELFTILRNYSSFLFRWIEHENGNEYLLCGEDYQGYVCLNLTKRQKHVYFPDAGFQGCGFCWTDIEEYEPDWKQEIRVDGCYWACPYEIVWYDFSNPDSLPYPENRREYEDYEDDDDDEDEEKDEAEKE
jgi:hypothetical protein